MQRNEHTRHRRRLSAILSFLSRKLCTVESIVFRTSLDYGLSLCKSAPSLKFINNVMHRLHETTPHYSLPELRRLTERIFSSISATYSGLYYRCVKGRNPEYYLLPACIQILYFMKHTWLDLSDIFTSLKGFPYYPGQLHQLH